MIKIGYQGIENSNNHIAAEKFIESEQLTDFVLLPLTGSENVVKNLLAGEIDLGIMAISNSYIGQIKETKTAMEGRDLTEVSRIEFPIIHAAFKLNAGLKNSEVKFVVSHEAALEQCRNNIKTNYPNAELLSIKNTGLGPAMLLNGEISPLSVILCPPKAGEKFNLYMDNPNLSDNESNITTFGVFKPA